MEKNGLRGMRYWSTRVAFTILAAVLVLIATLSCKPAVETERLTFANLHLAASTLIYIAHDKHYFSGNGLAVTIKENDTGLATTDALLKGQAELGTMAEFLMVSNVLQKKPLHILGTMDKTMTIELIGLKKRGVTKASDLAGKRIGLGRGTSAEFYLGRFLEINGRNIRDVTMVDTPPAKLRDAVVSGAVDAVVAWAPYSMQIKELSPGDTVVWQVQSGQSVFGLIVGTNDWITSHPDTVSRFWKSLAQSQEFLAHHPDEAKELLRHNVVGFDRNYIDAIWPQFDFSLSLDQSLIIAMEDEARWMIKNSLTTERHVPVFANFINENGLKAVRPEAVNIIR